MKKRIEEQIGETHALEPSIEFAWMIGHLAGGGYVDSTDGSVRSFAIDSNLQRRFVSTGEELFKMNSSRSTERVGITRREVVRVRFSGVPIARAVGDLRRGEWANTVRTKHGWILENSDYSWGFLEGLFETHSSIDDRKNKRRIAFNTIFKDEVLLLQDTLLSVGVNYPILLPYKDAKQGVQGVQISNLRDMKYFAEHIHTSLPDMEKKLEFFRHYVPPYEISRINSPEDLINEYQRLKDLLGYPPKASEINTFKKKGETRHSLGIYSYYFSSGESFVEARRNMELVLGRREGKNDDQILAELDSEPRFRHFHHGFTDEQVVNAWKALREDLHRIPKSTDIVNLHREGKIPMSLTAFARMGGGSFEKAQEVLELTIRTEDGTSPEQALKAIRQEVRPGAKFSDNEIFDEWERLIDELGRSPSANRIHEMKSKGQTRMSVSVYTHRFKGPFSQVSKILDEIIKDRKSKKD